MYQSHHKGKLPDQIAIYRDGVGGPSLVQKVIKYEIKHVIEELKTYSQGFNPKVIYCLVNRNVTHRLFQMNTSTACINPGPGTVVDTALVENQGDQMFDFFMIPHNATVATAQPVHFQLAYNSSGLDKEDIEISTYHLCYDYFNFSGSIKVPSACMYAHKIVNYANDNIHKTYNNVNN